MAALNPAPKVNILGVWEGRNGGRDRAPWPAYAAQSNKFDPCRKGQDHADQEKWQARQGPAPRMRRNQISSIPVAKAGITRIR
jgi:hypothetical protein